jgi:hypothetical protein
MTTTLYLLGQASDLDTNWTKRVLHPVRGDGSVGYVTNTAASGTAIQVTDVAGGNAQAWYSPPLAGVTISGPLTFNVRGLESNAAANACAGIKIERCDNSGASLSTMGQTNVTGTEYTTSDAASNHTYTLTSTTLATGDRLKVTLYVNNVGTMGASQTVTNTVGGTSAAAAGDSYITLTETVATACPATSTFAENFNSNSISAPAWHNQFGGAGTSVSGATGRAVFTTTTTAGYAGMYAKGIYDLTGSAISCQLVSAGNTALASLETTPVQLLDGSGRNRIAFYLNGGTISATQTVNGALTSLTSVAYNVLNHAYLRIREASGTTYWEVSTDGSVWNAFGSASNPINVTRLTLEPVVGTYANEASGTTVVIDNYNILSVLSAYTLDPGPAGDVYWSGLNWTTSSWTAGVGTPASQANITGPDSNGYLTMQLTNIGGGTPVGAEMYTTRGMGDGNSLGYGTYTTVFSGAFSTQGVNNVLGLFTYANGMSSTGYNEIDMVEIAGWGNTPITAGTGYFWGPSDTRVDMQMGATLSGNLYCAVMKWEPGRLAIQVFASADTSGPVIINSISTVNIPVPGSESVDINLWSFSHATNPTPITVTLRSFTFSPLAQPTLTTPVPTASQGHQPGPVAVISRNLTAPYDVRILGQIGRVRGVTFTSVLPGGPSSFACTVDADPNGSPSALQANRWLTVQAGGHNVWSGTLEDAKRGAPWQVTGLGIAMQGKKFAAHSDTDVQGVITYAMTQGLPWNTPSPSMPARVGTTVLKSVFDFMNDAPLWQVDVDGNVTTYVPPTVPTLMMNAAQSPARTVDDMANSIFTLYNVGGVATLAGPYENAASIAKFGRRQISFDLTSRGNITLAQADTASNAVLLKTAGYGASYTEAITVRQGQLLNIGGVPVDIRFVSAGTMVRVRGTEVDHAWDLNGSTNFVIGEAVYSDDNATLTMTPWASMRRDLASILTAAAELVIAAVAP